MGISSKAFSETTAGIRNLVVTISILVGSIWTLFTFTILGEKNRAEAELRVLELESEKQAAIDIEINMSQVTLPGGDGFAVIGTVILENLGNRNTRMQYPKEGAFSVSSAKAGDDLFYRADQLISTSYYKLESPSETPGWVLVRAGARERIPFLLRLRKPGAYYMSFTANLSPEEREVAEEGGVPQEVGAVWRGSRFFLVNEEVPIVEPPAGTDG